MCVDGGDVMLIGFEELLKSSECNFHDESNDVVVGVGASK